MKPHIFQASYWTGKSWLGLLSLLFIIEFIIYVAIHSHKSSCDCGTDYNRGREYVVLDKQQLQKVNNLLAMYETTDTTKPDTTKRVSVQRNLRPAEVKLLMSFLENEYDGKLDTAQRNDLDSLLHQLTPKEAATYLAEKKFKVCSYFFLIGPGTYLEVLLWALAGVLCSLLFYVAEANKEKLRPTTNPEVHPFDNAEIPYQLAKLLYAPIAALVLVLGYSFFNSDTKMIDISAGKGLIVFSFIAGFYSGRVMKFLDRIKDILIPAAAPNVENRTQSTTPPPTATGAVSVTLGLTASLAATPEGVAIAETGFNTATVTLTGEDGKTVLPLTNPTDDQGNDFTAEKIPYGKYNLKASMAFEYTGAATATILNLEASQPVEINSAEQAITVLLDKNPEEG